VVLEHLELIDFRNYRELDLRLPSGLVLLVGENAQGKTAFLEALYLLGTSRSFRASREAELLGWGCQKARVRALFRRDRGSTRELEINWIRTGERGVERRILRNGTPLRRLADLLGEVPMALFTPADLGLIQGAPQGRRRFLDLLLCKISPLYLSALTRYGSVLRQRNELLRRRPAPSPAELEPWEEQLAALSAILVPRRQEVVYSLQEAVTGIFGRLSEGRTDLCLTYRPAVPPEPERFLSVLRARRREDLARGSTQAGPHRDDLELLLDGRSLQRYGSQGQHRSAALALRLAEARVMGENAEETALVLLDDCLSELDVGRGQRLLEILGGYRQVFLTTTIPPPNLSDYAGLFRVVAGSLEKA
jgi:DNA replication and repair protein RecF